jgi:hypothetical protein
MDGKCKRGEGGVSWNMELSNASIHVYTHTHSVCVDNNNKSMKMFHVGGLLFFLYIPRRPSNFSLSSASVGTSQKIK